MTTGAASSTRVERSTTTAPTTTAPTTTTTTESGDPEWDDPSLTPEAEASFLASANRILDLALDPSNLVSDKVFYPYGDGNQYSNETALRSESGAKLPGSPSGIPEISAESASRTGEINVSISYCRKVPCDYDLIQITMYFEREDWADFDHDAVDLAHIADELSKPIYHLTSAEFLIFGGGKYEYHLGKGAQQTNGNPIEPADVADEISRGLASL